MENEFRVREVRRHVVTHYHSTDDTGPSVRTFGPFESKAQANEIAAALHRTTPGSTLVEAPEGKEPIGTFYAYTESQATRMMAIAQENNIKPPACMLSNYKSPKLPAPKDPLPF